MLNKSIIALAVTALSIASFSALAAAPAPAPATATQEVTFTKTVDSTCKIAMSGTPEIDGNAITFVISGNDVTTGNVNTIKMTNLVTTTTNGQKFNSSDLFIIADGGQTDTAVTEDDTKDIPAPDGVSSVKINVNTVPGFVYKGVGKASAKMTWLVTCGVAPTE